MDHNARDAILEFLKGIGIPVQERRLPDATFLPGIAIEKGVLVYDPEKLAYPGDLLHEAGHLAVVPKAERGILDQDVGGDAGLEMAAIAWSYAVIVFLGLPIEVLFHPNGYKGGSASLCENFAQGRYIGVPVLEWRGMTDYQRPGAAASPTRYPLMRKWLCD
jgi:hypothetical protein